MKIISLLLIVFFVFTASHSQVKVASGEVIRHENFASDFVDARNVDVWLPAGYSQDKKYAVLYMHDGQMLFDASTTWNKQEWGVDEIITQLMADGKIKDCIVVGIWNNDNKRHAEYFPQRAWNYISKSKQEKILKAENISIQPEMFEKGLLADNYLRFIVRELKPFIDAHYNTLPDKKNTFIMGSSMGGLISCYAICEYPGIFGGAACMSTHWPTINGSVLKYVKNNLPTPESHKIYFDHGTATLDSLYQPYQQKVDAMMLKRGYKPGQNFVSKIFEGEAHTEDAWKKRLHIPLEFLLEK
ncbi:alpha/beta hydrolase [Marinilabiliaceae bacterium JC017]|nr:alpha/beta hydrolase [Marinilabiliaceae bacterium JC017]